MVWVARSEAGHQGGLNGRFDQYPTLSVAMANGKVVPRASGNNRSIITVPRSSNHAY